VTETAFRLLNENACARPCAELMPGCDGWSRETLSRAALRLLCLFSWVVLERSPKTTLNNCHANTRLQTFAASVTATTCKSFSCFCKGVQQVFRALSFRSIYRILVSIKERYVLVTFKKQRPMRILLLIAHSLMFPKISNLLPYTATHIFSKNSIRSRVTSHLGRF